MQIITFLPSHVWNAGPSSLDTLLCRTCTCTPIEPLRLLTTPGLNQQSDIAFLMKLLQLIKAVITKDLCLYLYFILNMRKRGKEG